MRHWKICRRFALTFAQSNPVLAERQARLIVNSIKTLDQFPEIGRIGREPGTREITFRPWIAVYKIATYGVLIVHIWHGRQGRGEL